MWAESMSESADKVWTRAERAGDGVVRVPEKRTPAELLVRSVAPWTRSAAGVTGSPSMVEVAAEAVEHHRRSR